MLHTPQKRLDLLYIVIVASMLSVFAHMETERRGKEAMAYNPQNNTASLSAVPEIKEKHDSVSPQTYVRANKSDIIHNPSLSVIPE